MSDYDYQIELAEGIFLHFDLFEYEKGEPASHDCPGEPEVFSFRWKIKFDDAEYLDDLSEVKDCIDKVLEGDDIQDLMEAEYKEQNQPEPDAN